MYPVAALVIFLPAYEKLPNFGYNRDGWNPNDLLLKLLDAVKL
jgi:hypothetical protein